ncbi:TATA-binding protein-associated factor mot1, partial [Coemansia sp. Cherry 401B]
AGEQEAEMDADWLTFEQFDVDAVLRNGRLLLGSAGKEYDEVKATGQERVAMQRAQIKQRLGLGAQFLDEDLLDDVDLGADDVEVKVEVKVEAEQPKGGRKRKASVEAKGETSQADEIDMSKLSARERNRLKRKARMEGKKKKVDVGPKTSNGDAARADATRVDVTEQPGGDAIVVEARRDGAEFVRGGGTWMFAGVVEVLGVDLFDAAWEVRHGAAMALREIFKHHGFGAGRVSGATAGANAARNQRFLEDMSVRLACVFVLDRFSDFVGDQAVGPVRETCAQALGAVSRSLAPAGVGQLQAALLQACARGADRGLWQVRHAALSGLRYVAAVRRDLAGLLAGGTVDAALDGLRAGDDDVRAVAAATLAPLADALAACAPARIAGVVDAVWAALDAGDDLAASAAGAVDVLARLVARPAVRAALADTDWAARAPRLLRLLRHALASVRRAAVEALHTFAEMGAGAWADGACLQCVFQNLVLETQRDVLDASAALWRVLVAEFRVRADAALLPVADMFTLAATPIGQPLPRALLLDARAGGHDVDAAMVRQDLGLVARDTVVRCRVRAGVALGLLAAALPAAMGPVLVRALGSGWALQTQLAGVVAEEWALASADNPASADDSASANGPAADELRGRVRDALMDALARTDAFDDMRAALPLVRAECQRLCDALAESSASAEPLTLPEPFTLAAAQQLAATEFDSALPSRVLKALNERRLCVQAAIATYEQQHQQLLAAARAACAAAVVASGTLPPKLNAVLRALMAAVRGEESELLQLRAADAVARLAALCYCVESPRRAPADKMVSNVAALACADAPVFAASAEEGILPDAETSAADKVAVRGAEAALAAMARQFGAQLLDAVPRLWATVADPLTAVYGGELAFDEIGDDVLDAADARLAADAALAQSAVDALRVLAAMATPALDASLHARLARAMRWAGAAAGSRFAAVRSAAARALAAGAGTDAARAMLAFVRGVVPRLADARAYRRQGAAESIAAVVHRLDTDVLAYVPFLMVPVLGRMSDGDAATRLVCTRCFAQLLRLVPLEAAAPDPPGFPPELVAQRTHERAFLAQLMDPTRLEPFAIPVRINAKLRRYQQEGVDWLAFLNKYELHGVLCDDMGLGKTLQTICIVASDHHLRRERGLPRLPSLVVCPPTLIGHWEQEVRRYVENLAPLCYAGAPAERRPLLKDIAAADVVIMSYDVARNDIEHLQGFDFNYCVLDEGHCIRNAKTKLTQAVKRLRARRRLILSGTPVQNNVLELWSLFDFLMPGFLGPERQFNDQYSKPILASRDARQPQQQQAGEAALQQLHRQVLPFLLRRMKEDVLQDLPPKIIQDYYCELSPLQRQLYDEFARSAATDTLRKSLGIEAAADSGEENGAGEETKKKATHVFQALQYLRRLCNHPALVLTPRHPLYEQVTRDLRARNSDLHSLDIAPKLLALRDLLHQCGIGSSEAAATDDDAVEPVSASHRVLIFCQHKEMIERIEQDLFARAMPSVTFMRVDGSVESRRRHEIVTRFNADPSIDCLLLTTHVGGLGLNLTGADTVIFVEHDYNPAMDLQAMDRAHRLGQTRVVNVYRLITRNTLEEKIMNVQAFKLHMANSIVNQQNAGLASMNTDQLLDLFDAAPAKAKPKEGGAEQPAKSVSKAIEGLEELWDANQYEDEFNLDQFIQSLEN